MDQLNTFFSHIPNGAYYAIATAAVVSIVLQFVKKWLSLQSDKVVNFLLGVFSFLPVAVDYLNHATAQNPAVLGSRTAIIMAISTVLYHQLLKPTSTLLKDAKTERKRRTNTTASDEQVNTVNVIEASEDFPA